ncbi:D-tagaturonate epimerase UxaE [soil metagenome]
MNYKTVEQYADAEIIQIVRNLPDVHLYENSIQNDDNCWYFLIRKGISKHLIIASEKREEITSEFSGDNIEINSYPVIKCELNTDNAQALRSRFQFANPVLIGKTNSYGFGDRLGNAGAAHLRAVRKTRFRPILAQQSIRELDRTNRTAQEVMDAASWAVFQEGFTAGFGADADHLKTTDHIDRMVNAGFTMFTIDPSDHVVNEARMMDLEELNEAFTSLPWKQLHSQPEELLKRYLSEELNLKNNLILTPSKHDLLTGMVKYGHVITHTKKLADYLESTYPNHSAELELSVDETELPTTPFEHFLIAAELSRLDVQLVSLAPRFCGDFEKGIDFKGDLDQFRAEYEQHLAIAEKFGGYKLSIHSGSDKFSIYKVIGSIDSGAVHVKTAGTSYLEALRTIAEADPDLFWEILSFSIKRFSDDKKTYHISANPDRVPSAESLNNHQLPLLLNNDDARQVLHVTYGSILSEHLPEAKSIKKRVMKSLEENETLHEKNLINHFNKHLDPFNLKNYE